MESARHNTSNCYSRVCDPRIARDGFTLDDVYASMLIRMEVSREEVLKMLQAQNCFSEPWLNWNFRNQVGEHPRAHLRRTLWNSSGGFWRIRAPGNQRIGHQVGGFLC